MAGDSKQKKVESPAGATQEDWVRGVQKVLNALRKACERTQRSKPPAQEQDRG